MSRWTRKRAFEEVDHDILDLTNEDEEVDFVEVRRSPPKKPQTGGPIVLDDDVEVRVPPPSRGAGRVRRGKSKARMAPSMEVVTVVDDDEEVEEVINVDNIADAVLEVFPDCAYNFLTGLVKRLKSKPQVINYLVEHADYPRSKTAGESFSEDAAGRSGSASSSSKPSAVTAASSSDSVITMEKMARNLELLAKADAYREAATAAANGKGSEPSENYVSLAVANLSKSYAKLSVKNIREVLQKNGSRFFATKEAIKKTMFGELLHRPADAEPLDSATVEKTVSSNCRKAGWQYLAKPRAVTIPELPDGEFEAELAFSIEFDKMEQEKMDQAMREKMANEAAEKEGDLIECGCCCGEYAFDVLVQCTEGHLFCPSCLRRYAQTRVFEENRTGLLCMSVNEECAGTFTDNQLIRVLDPKVYLKYQERAAEEAIKAANLDDLVTCPACGYKAELEHDVSVFTCPNKSCGKETCRHCQEPKHPGLRCEEVEKSKDTNFRTTIEEAMTAAKVRTCPKAGCKTAFVKETGCNKITCTGCNTLVCYICREIIPAKVSYGHFCQTPHCNHESCKKCPLWTNAEEDDKRAVREAALKAKEQAKASTSEEVKDVDVDELLTAGVPNQPAAPAHVGYGGAFNFGLHAPAVPVPANMFPLPLPVPRPAAVAPYEQLRQQMQQRGVEFNRHQAERRARLARQQAEAAPRQAEARRQLEQLRRQERERQIRDRQARDFREAHMRRHQPPPVPDRLMFGQYAVPPAAPPQPGRVRYGGYQAPGAINRMAADPLAGDAEIVAIRPPAPRVLVVPPPPPLPRLAVPLPPPPAGGYPARYADPIVMRQR